MDNIHVLIYCAADEQRMGKHDSSELTMKDIYGAGILFFYFLKWPIVIIYPYLLTHGLRHNVFLDLLWLHCLFLIFKDAYTTIKKR